MYIIGKTHPHKQVAQLLLEQLITERARLVTNAEVLQEILHRYKAINLPDAIQPALDCLFDFTDEVYPVTQKDVLLAKEILFSYKNLSARDALHVAHLQRYKIKTLLSFDSGFDQIPGLTRLYQVS